MADESNLGELTAEVRFASWFRFSNMLRDDMGQRAYDWEECQEDEQSAWGDAFVACQKIVAEADRTRYESIAQKVYEAYHRVMTPSGDRPEWIMLVAQEKLYWIFMVRHMVNLLLLDPEDDGSPEQHEEQMRTAFNDKLTELSGTPT